MDDIGAQLRRAAEREADGDLAGAADTYRALLARLGDNASLHAALAAIEQRLGNDAQAMQAYRRALAIDPGLAAAASNLAALVHAAGDAEEALALYARAVDAGAGAAACCGRALVRQDCGDLAGALDDLRQAIRLEPGLAVAHFNLANVLGEAGHLDEALAAYRTALSLDPGLFDARWNMSHVLLRKGEYREGFAAFEARWNLPALKAALARQTAPFWDGEVRPGATLLVWGEQGFGDVLQFVRYLPGLASAGMRIVLAVQPELAALMSGLAGVAQVVALDDPAPPHDWHCPVMSLPRLCGTTVATIPASTPYLAVDPARADRFARLLPADGRLRVGLVWSSGIRRHLPTLYRFGLDKSLPARLFDAFAQPGVRLVSLQVGSDAGRPAVAVDDFGAELQSFADSAALVAALDLVVTVDTAVAHLAGALGKPAWILLNTQACWRWALDASHSPWYPQARLYRQSAPGDWREPVAAVARDLRALASTRAPRGWWRRLFSARR